MEMRPYDIKSISYMSNERKETPSMCMWKCQFELISIIKYSALSCVHVSNVL